MAAKRADPEKKPDGGASRRASWRGPDRPDQPSAAERSWQRLPGGKRSPAELRRIRSRRLKLAIFTTLLVVLGVAYVWQFQAAPATTLIAVALTDYPPPLPPNAFGFEDVARFESLAHQDAGTFWSLLGKSGGTLAAESKIVPHEQRALWDDKKALDDIELLWKDAKLGGPDHGWFRGGGTRVVYLSGHGTVDNEGHPCLILENRKLLNIDELIKRFADPHDRVHTLLILDANRSLACWPAGLIYNGFAEAIKASADLEAAGSIAVLLSAGPGEIAWAAPERRDTPFGRFVAEALAGAPQADSDPDEKISVTELHQFVKGRLSDWVATNRAAQQSPILYPPNRDFPVVFVGKPTAPPSQVQESFYFADQSTREDWDQLNKPWKLNEGLEQQEDDADTPLWYEHCLDWHRFQQGMVRCEQLLLAGAAYKDRFRVELDTVNDLAEKLKAAGTREPLRHNLATIHVAPDRQTVKDFSQHFDAAPGGEPPPDLPTDYYQRAGVAWRFLRDEADQHKLGGTKVLKALELIKQPPDGKAEPAELHLLRLLAGKPDRPWTSVSNELWTAEANPVAAALKLRELAERTITVGDPRTLDGIRLDAEKGDDKVRAFEDSLFTGDAQLPAAVDAEQVFKKTRERSRALARCFATRDRAWAWLPYLTDWSMRVPENKNLVDVAAHTLDQAAELDRLLAAYLSEDARLKGQKQPAHLDALNDTESDVSAGLNSLKSTLDTFANAALAELGKSHHAVKVRDIEFALGNPLVDWAQRKRLRDHVGSLEATTSTETSPAAGKSGKKMGASDDDPQPEVVGQPYYLERLTTWWKTCEHPGLILAEIDKPESDSEKKQFLDSQFFAALHGRLTQDIIDKLKSDPAGTNAAAIDRKLLSEKERPLRRAAALCGFPLSRGIDGIQRLAQYDRNALLMWQAKRRLDDFWGPDDGQPYFGKVFDECRQEADEVAHDFEAHWDDLNNVRDQRHKTIKSPLVSNSSSDAFRLSENRAFNANLNLMEVPFPRGTAALSVWEPVRPNPPAQIERTDGKGQAQGKTLGRLAIETPTRAEPLALRVSRMPVPNPAPLPEGESKWPLAWSFRGHEGTISLPVKILDAPIELVYDWKPSNTASVAVEGEIKEAAVVFILDCSASMNEPASVLVDGRVKRGNRMLAATVTLRRIIERLSHAGRPDVGLWLYGHRLGIDTNRVFVPYDRKEWKVPPSALPNLRPGDDVECEVTMGPLNEARVARINNVLNVAKPHGMTPLYLAMVQALDDFRLAPVRGPRRLVVITDGVNVQEDKFAKKPTTLNPTGTAAVQTKLKGISPPVKIELLFCGSDNEPKTADEQKALDDLKQLIGDVGGEFTPVVDWINLEQNLQAVLGLKEFVVERKGGKLTSTTTKMEQQIGTRMSLDDNFVPGQPVEYDVKIVGQPGVQTLVKLEGGEALTLDLLAGGKLVHEPASWDEDTNLKPRVVANSQWKGAADADPKEFRVFCLPPGPQPDGRQRFSLAIENADPNRFSPRPKEAWIEITPVTDKGELPSYPCYDLAFKRDQPVPVLYCDVKWPPEATRARMKLWFKLYPAPTGGVQTKEQRIKQCVEADGAAPVERSDWLPGVKIGVTIDETTPGKCVLIVEEEHSDDGPVQWARVQVVDLDQPDKIVHTFHHEAKMARHHFHFNAIRSQVINGAVRVTAGEAVQTGAMAVVDPPMEVKITR